MWTRADADVTRVVDARSLEVLWKGKGPEDVTASPSPNWAALLGQAHAEIIGDGFGIASLRYPLCKNGWFDCKSFKKKTLGK